MDSLTRSTPLLAVAALLQPGTRSAAPRAEAVAVARDFHQEQGK